MVGIDIFLNNGDPSERHILDINGMCNSGYEAAAWFMENGCWKLSNNAISDSVGSALAELSSKLSSWDSFIMPLHFSSLDNVLNKRIDGMSDMRTFRVVAERSYDKSNPFRYTADVSLGVGGYESEGLNYEIARVNAPNFVSGMKTLSRVVLSDSVLHDAVLAEKKTQKK
ncbi:hypothetical protein HN903_02105 [archaeon]|jgi:hypothetical protein|nr:hypothetical protein [archaeon]MBT7128525.1 hypothetical protein [archaeon]